MTQIGVAKQRTSQHHWRIAAIEDGKVADLEIAQLSSTIPTIPLAEQWTGLGRPVLKVSCELL